MIELRKANLKDAKKEYELLQKIPAEENGLNNNAHDLTYEEFKNDLLPTWLAYDKGEKLPKGWVPGTNYFLWVDDTPVGIYKLRHRLNDFLRNGPGHISYGIAKEYRGKGYATIGLKLVLEKARELPIDTPEAYLSSLKSNPASFKVMQKNGGYLHHEDDTHYYTRIPL